MPMQLSDLAAIKVLLGPAWHKDYFTNIVSLS